MHHNHLPAPCTSLYSGDTSTTIFSIPRQHGNVCGSQSRRDFRSGVITPSLRDIHYFVPGRSSSRPRSRQRRPGLACLLLATAPSAGFHIPDASTRPCGRRTRRKTRRRPSRWRAAARAEGAGIRGDAEAEEAHGRGAGGESCRRAHRAARRRVRGTVRPLTFQSARDPRAIFQPGEPVTEMARPKRDLITSSTASLGMLMPSVFCIDEPNAMPESAPIRPSTARDQNQAHG